MKRTQTESFPLGQPSTSCGDKVFQWMIAPLSEFSFKSLYLEKKPHLVKRNQLDYYSGLISRKTIENYVKAEPEYAAESLIFTREGDEGKEIFSETSVDQETLLNMLDKEGWTVQAVHPQQKNAKVHALLERLENYTGSVWGSNLYIKSSSKTDDSCCTFNSFSDNIELYILPLAGSVRWRVYEGETLLSRDSGADFEEDNLGPPILDETVQPGDLLYIPRGFIYTHESPESGFQYLSLSTYQNQSWCDFLSTTFSETLESVTKQKVQFREGLPFNWISLFGSAIEETGENKDAREEFTFRVKDMMHTVIESINFDEIVDQFGSDFIALRTPPVRVVVDSEETDPTQMKTLIFTCIENDVTNHMKTDNPLDCEPASIEIQGTKSVEGLKEMLKVWPECVELEMLSREVSGELWDSGIVETVEVVKHARNS